MVNGDTGELNLIFCFLADFLFYFGSWLHPPPLTWNGQRLPQTQKMEVSLLRCSARLFASVPSPNRRWRCRTIPKHETGLTYYLTASKKVIYPYTKERCKQYPQLKLFSKTKSTFWPKMSYPHILKRLLPVCLALRGTSVENIIGKIKEWEGESNYRPLEKNKHVLNVDKTSNRGELIVPQIKREKCQQRSAESEHPI